MTKYYTKPLQLFFLISAVIIAGANNSNCDKIVQSDGTKTLNGRSTYKVTFIELGSAKCIPCKMMQPVIAQIEKEYPDVKVLFYDVRTPEGREYGSKYSIRLIPTQIFLDKDGKEYFRHEGFFPKEEIEKILEQKGAAKKRLIYE